MTEHRALGNEIVDGGIVHHCSCGWTSRPCFSNAIASTEGMTHREDAELAATRAVIFTRAFVPDKLVKPWLQHLRDFDIAHPGCHFEVMADTGGIPLEVMVEMLRLKPGFTFQKIFAHAEDERLYDVARDTCHQHGMPWTDPRTGTTYPPPKKD